MALTPNERAARYRARKRGEPVAPIPRNRGYKQAPEHVAKRIRTGPDHHAWKGDDVSVQGGRSRALRAYPEAPPCQECGDPNAERHHIDGNTANNDPSNIEFLCRRCHMAEDGRTERLTRARWGPRG